MKISNFDKKQIKEQVKILTEKGIYPLRATDQSGNDLFVYEKDEDGHIFGTASPSEETKLFIEKFLS